MIKKFKVVQCCYCGHYQIMGGLNFKCKICNHSTKLKLKSKFGLHLKYIKSFNTGLEAQHFISKFNEERLKDKFQGFKSFEVKNKVEHKKHFVGLCVYCKEELSEEEMVLYDNKPFHKKCVEKYKEIGKTYCSDFSH